MSSLRKLEATEERAYLAYRAAAAELVLFVTELGPTEPTWSQLIEKSRLRQRAGAYRAQWTSCARRVEDALIERHLEPHKSTRVDRRGKRAER